jgi:hypothetical protein
MPKEGYMEDYPGQEERQREFERMRNPRTEKDAWYAGYHGGWGEGLSGNLKAAFLRGQAERLESDRSLARERELREHELHRRHHYFSRF